MSRSLQEIHNSAQERAADGEVVTPPHDTFNLIIDSVCGAYGGNAHEQNSASNAGATNGSNNRSSK